MSAFFIKLLYKIYTTDRRYRNTDTSHHIYPVMCVHKHTTNTNNCCQKNQQCTNLFMIRKNDQRNCHGKQRVVRGKTIIAGNRNERHNNVCKCGAWTDNKVA